MTLIPFTVNVFIVVVVFGYTAVTSTMLYRIATNKTLETPADRIVDVVDIYQCHGQCHHNDYCTSFSIQTNSNPKRCHFFSGITTHYLLNQSMLVERPGFTFYAKVIESCAGWYKAGARDNGVYTVIWQGEWSLRFYCNMVDGGGGWTVFQYRHNGVVPFKHRTWQEYKAGFGDFSTEFWLGNEMVHKLTNIEPHDSMLVASDFDGNVNQIKALGFRLESEQTFYKMRIDSEAPINGNWQFFSKINGIPFSTAESDHDSNSGVGINSCAYRYGAWWHTDCHSTAINGDYPQDKVTGACPYANGLIWTSWKDYLTSLKTTMLMIRPSSF